jgi:hypothetical protein
MGTTTVLVELVIVGMQAITALTLLLLGIFGYGQVDDIMSNLNDWSALVSIIVVGIFYTSGIIADRFWDGVAKVWSPIRPFPNLSWIRNKATSILTEDRARFDAIDGTLATNQL